MGDKTLAGTDENAARMNALVAEGGGPAKKYKCDETTTFPRIYVEIGVE